MNHEKHPWKVNNSPDRVDNINGWNSPLIKFAQKSLHPYLLLCHSVEKANHWDLFKDRTPGDGNIKWPKEIIKLKGEKESKQTIEIFNGALVKQDFNIEWELRWDSADGEVVESGKTKTQPIEAGFHRSVYIMFIAPKTNNQNRKLFLVLKSIVDGQEVFLENQIYFNVE